MNDAVHEDILTDQFASLLACEPLGRAWLARLSGVALDALTGPVRVTTQVSYPLPDGRWVRVDVVLRGEDALGKQLLIFLEHKANKGTITL